MKILRLFACALLTCLVGVANAQTWTWTGEAPAAGDFYIRSNVNDVFIKATSAVDANPANATLFTLSAATNCTIAYEDDGTKYVYEGSGNANWGTTNDRKWTIASQRNTNNEYWISHTDPDYTTRTRYIQVSSTGIDYPRNNFNGNNRLLMFISPAQMTAYNNYVSAWKSLSLCAGEKPISLDLKNRIATALSEAVNYANSTEKISSMNALVTEYNNYIASLATATKASPKDVSGLITNPGYEASTWNQGWTGTGDNKDVSFAKNDNHTVYAEMWKGGAVGGKIYQTISNLPKGYYTLSASTAGDVLNSVYAKVGAHVYQQAKGEGDWNRTSVVFRIDEEQADVEIGYLRPDNVWWWSAVDDFQLEYMGTNPTYEYNIGIRLDGSYLSKPAYTSTPMDGVDPEHPNDALLVITWRGNSTTDPTDAVNPIYKLMSGSKAEILADGSKVADAELLSDFRSSHYDNGFGLYIPDFDETKTYTIKVPANVFGYTTVGHGNEAFEVQAVASPLKDGKYFVVVKGTGKHVSRGKGWGTQAILDYYGVPMLVQTAGLTVFKFLDNNAFLGSDPNDDWLFTDINGREAHKVRRYILIPGEDAHEGEFLFYTPARDKYLSHVQNTVAGETYDAINEGGNADYFQFELLDEDGYKAHLATIEEDEAIRVAAHAGFGVTNMSEYDALIGQWASKGHTTVFPVEGNAEQEEKAAAYHEKMNADLASPATWDDLSPRDLVGGEKVSLTLDKGLYVMSCDAFQQAMALDRLQANQGFRGLTYMYVKAGSEMYKSQLKSITETTGTIPTDEASAISALDAGTYRNQVIFYVPADATQVVFGVENPQRLGNGIDGTAGSWVAFKNIKVEKFNAELVEASMKVAAGKYGTFLAPFAVTVPAGVDAFSGKLNSTNSSVALTSVLNEGSIAACTPVVVYNGGEKDVDMTFRGVDGRDDKTTVTETVGNLVGFYKSYAEDNAALIQGDGSSWVLQTQNDKQAFYKVEPGKTFKGSKNRCYLVAPAAAGVKELNFVFGEDDTETAIEKIEDGTLKIENGIFDLSGRRVQKAQKGIYIINGKKVVIK